MVRTVVVLRWQKPRSLPRSSAVSASPRVGVVGVVGVGGRVGCHFRLREQRPMHSKRGDGCRPLTHSVDESGLRRRCLPLDDYVWEQQQQHQQQHQHQHQHQHHQLQVPTSGLEYLRLVRLEELRDPRPFARADTAPAPVRSKRHAVFATANSAREAKRAKSEQSLPPPLRMSPSVFDALVAGFAQLKQRVDEARAELRSRHQGAPFYLPVKETASEKDWRDFCYPVTATIADDQPHVDLVQGSSAGLTPLIPHLPLLPVIVWINHTIACHLLILHKSWIASGTPSTVSVLEFHWILMLLACLETPLFPEQMSLLRDIVRKCVDIRSTWIQKGQVVVPTMDDEARLHPHDERIRAIHAILAAVTGFYGQADLRDPFADSHADAAASSLNVNTDDTGDAMDEDMKSALHKDEDGELHEEDECVTEGQQREMQGCENELARVLWESHLLGDERYF